MNCFGLWWTACFKKSGAVGDDPLTSVDNHIPDSTVVENPLVHHTSLDNPVPRCVLQASISSTYHLPTVETTLLDLPYHIITDILIRLPAEYIVRCQHASKLLKFLTKTHSFVRTHLARQTTSIIALQPFSQSSDWVIKLYFMDEQAKQVKKAKLKLDLFYTQKTEPVMLYGSCDGFLLFRNKNYLYSPRSIFVIWNPITEEQVTITMGGLHFIVCGFYFNPHHKEYEVLLLSTEVGTAREYVCDVLSLGSKLRRNVGIFSYTPRRERPPTIINGTLYWMIDDIYGAVKVSCSDYIMAFEIGTNKFSTVGVDISSLLGTSHHYMHLIDFEGHLGLCVLSSELVLWVQNPATNSWAKTYSVTVPEYYMSKYYISCWRNSMDVEVLKIKDGKLLLRQKNRLLLYDLETNTHTIVEKKGFENDSFWPVIYTHSLVSLDTDKLIHLVAE